MSLVEELKRKAIHMLSAAVPLAYAALLSRRQAAAMLALMSAGMLMIEFIRLRDHWAGRTFRKYFEPMLREKERSRIDPATGRRTRARWLGATPYCLASLLCVLIFPKPVAVLALLYLAVGDTAASLVGKTLGRTRIGDKSLEGTAAVFPAALTRRAPSGKLRQFQTERLRRLDAVVANGVPFLPLAANFVQERSDVFPARPSLYPHRTADRRRHHCHSRGDRRAEFP